MPYPARVTGARAYVAPLTKITRGTPEVSVFFWGCAVSFFALVCPEKIRSDAVGSACPTSDTTSGIATVQLCACSWTQKVGGLEN